MWNRRDNGLGRTPRSDCRLVCLSGLPSLSCVHRALAPTRFETRAGHGVETVMTELVNLSFTSAGSMDSRTLYRGIKVGYTWQKGGQSHGLSCGLM